MLECFEDGVGVTANDAFGVGVRGPSSEKIFFVRLAELLPPENIFV